MDVDVEKEAISIICTDRRDFYHQFATSRNRTLSNTVGPRVELSELADLSAFEDFQAFQARLALVDLVLPPGSIFSLARLVKVWCHFAAFFSFQAITLG